MVFDPKSSAEKIISLYWNRVVFPIDPVQIACKIGINVLFEKKIAEGCDEEVIGALVKTNGKPVTIMTDGRHDSRHRRRTLVAIMLGEYVKNIESKEVVIILQPEDYLTGRDVDRFAKHLLIPKNNLDLFEQISRYSVPAELVQEKY